MHFVGLYCIISNMYMYVYMYMYMYVKCKPEIHYRGDKSLLMDSNQRQINTPVTTVVHRLCPNVHFNITPQHIQGGAFPIIFITKIISGTNNEAPTSHNYLQPPIQIQISSTFP